MRRFFSEGRERLRHQDPPLAAVVAGLSALFRGRDGDGAKGADGRGVVARGVSGGRRRSSGPRCGGIGAFGSQERLRLDSGLFRRGQVFESESGDRLFGEDYARGVALAQGIIGQALGLCRRSGERLVERDSHGRLDHRILRRGAGCRRRSD